MKTRLEMIEEYDFNADDLIGTDEDETPTKWGVWRIHTNEFIAICDTKEAAEQVMDDYIENDYDENGYTGEAYEIREVL